MLSAALAGFGGLLIGSFLNVVAHRVPLGTSVVKGRSACPSCGTELTARDNIPLVSWIVLRGRCRTCRAPIGIKYPLVELATALTFAGVTALIGLEWTLPAYLWGAAVSIVLVVTDFEHRRIPNRILYPGFVVALVLLAGGGALQGEMGSVARAAAGAGAYFSGLLLLALLARGGFGFGDVKLGALLGLYAAHRSWATLAAAVFLAFVIGGVIAIGLLIARRAGRKDAIPFGPSLILGAAIAVAWGDAIVDWYLG